MLSQLLGIVLVFPFFGWAIFLLRRRFQFHEENSLVLEILTVAGLALFLWIELTILKYALDDQILLYLAAILALSVSTFALYAHVLISLASRILVDMVSPRGETAAYQPRFGPVDALEREEDYEGALQEYLVLARIYPRNFEVLSRTGRVQEILDRPEEAVAWYLRARKRATRAEEALLAVNHLCTLYDNQLGQPEEADHQLAMFIQDFPDAFDRDIVVERLERRAHRDGFKLSSLLDALEENPLALAPLEEITLPVTLPIAKPPIELVTLQTAGAMETKGKPSPAELRPKRPSGIGLERIDSASPPEDIRSVSNGPHLSAKPAASKSVSSTLGIAPLDEPLQIPEPTPENRDSKPRISLESMDS